MQQNQREVQNRYLSPNQKAFQRFKKNKPAIGGFWIITFAVFIAIFGYLLAPDSTPFANEQVLEIATSSPGFEMEMLEVRKNRPESSFTFLKRIFSGTENKNTLYPIEKFEVKGDSLFAAGYTGIEGKTKSHQFHVVDVLYAVKENSISTTADNYKFTDVNGKSKTIDKADLLSSIENKAIDKKRFWLGTDKFGRDNLSRLILGVRVSISVGLLAALISLVIGVFFGALAGYYKASPPKVSVWLLPAVIVAIIVLVYLFGFKSTPVRIASLVISPIIGYLFYLLFAKILSPLFNKKFTLPVDDIIMWFINVFWSIPLLLLVFALVLALGRQFWQIYLAVGLVMWVEIARIVRGQFLSLREQEFVEAAESLGFNNFRIIVKHILPNCIGPIIVITAANFASAIIIEAGLSFLGIGVQPPRPSWGIMLNEYYQYIGSSKSFLALIPGFAIMLLVLAFNLMGNGLRDAFDVKGRL